MKPLTENVYKKQQEKIFLGFSPHPGQLRILNAILNNKVKHTSLAIGRQWGKSTLAINLVLYWAINDPNSQIYYVTPTYRLAKELFERIEASTAKSGAIKNVNKTDLQLTFITGSKVHFMSAERPANLRGLSATYLIIDEMAFMKPDVWEVVLQPATMVKGAGKGKAIVFISSPAGKNHFYKVYQLGVSGEKNYQSFTAPSTENPYIDQADLEIARQNDLVFRSEYLAEFVDDYLQVFHNLDECTYGNLIDVFDPKEKYYMGVDLARKGDYTVVTVMNSKKKVVDIYRVRYAKWSFIVDRIVEIYHKWKISNGYVECNMNDRIVEELVEEKKCKNLKPFFTSLSSKNPMIEDLVLAFEKKEISIPKITTHANQKYNYDFLRHELETFTFTYNRNSGRLQYSAPSGLHDDCVISLGLCNSAHKDKHPRRGKLIWDKV